MPNFSEITNPYLTAPNVAVFEEMSIDYDINGQVTKLIKQGIQTDYTYNKFGDILVEKNALGLYTFRDYDKHHRVIKETRTNQSDISLIDESARITSFNYNHLGRVVSKTDVLGRKDYTKYDAYGNVSAYRDFEGQFTQNYYNTNNQLELVIDARGNHIYNHFNALNQLITVMDGAGNRTHYVYNALGHLIQTTNALGESQSFKVDMFGNVTEQIDALGHVTQMIYGPNQKVETIKYFDAEENELKRQEYVYDLIGNTIKEVTSFEDPMEGSQETIILQQGYDVLGNRIQSIDARNYETRYSYNGRKQLLKTHYPNGLDVVNVYDEDTGYRIETKQVDTTTLDASRNTSYTYNVFGEVIQETAPNGSFMTKDYRVDGQVKQESFSNDDLMSIEDDYIKTYGYDSHGRLIQISDNAAYNAQNQTYSNQVLETKTYNKYGDVTSLTTQAGLTTEYTYDALGRQTIKTDKNILVETTVNGQLQSITKDLITSYTYDALHRVVETTQPNGLILSVDYDEVGNVVSKTSTDGITSRTEAYVYNRFNQVTQSTNALNEITEIWMDALGRIVKTISPNNESIVYTYDGSGNKLKEVAYNAEDILVKQTEWVYDSMNQVTQTKEFRTINGVGENALTTNIRTAYGDCASVQDPSGYLVSYTYDNMGNKTKTSYANEHEIDYTYTLGGQLKEKSYSSKSSDPFNLFTVREIYTYTKDGKLHTKVDNPPLSESDQKKTETYLYTNGLLSEKTVTISSKVGLFEQIHNLDRVTYTYNSYGQVRVMKDLEGQTENHYAVNGQLSDVTRIKQTVSLNSSFVETSRTEVSRDSVRYEMDAWGNQTKLVYPDASTVTKTYDALNRLLTVTDSTGTTSYTYTTADRKVVETRPNGDVKTTLTEWGKVSSLISTRYDAMLETDVVFFEQSLSYDEAGNVVHEVRKQNDAITTIDNTYNARGELTQSTQITGLNKIVYQYLISPYGNKSEAITRYYDDEFILSESKAYVYNHLNQLESSTIDGITLEYEYDDFGNLVEEGNGSYTKTYAYDLNNRLSEVVEGPQTLQFSYDGNGNRLSKSINEVEVEYVNDTTIENEQVLSYTVETDVTNIVYGLTRLNEDAIGYLSDSYGNII